MNERPAPETDAFYSTFADGLASPSQAEWLERLKRYERQRDGLLEEVALWKKRIIPFLAVHAGNYGRDHYGENCLHFTHYDMLADAGGRMDDFKRCGDAAVKEGRP